MSNPTGTIDITNLVSDIQTDFVKYGSQFVFADISAIPGMQWVLHPIIAPIIQMVIRAVMESLTKWAFMQAFFLNTAIRKASQAQDYVNAINYKKALPPSASQDEYEKAERAQMLAFRNFVMVTN